MSIDISVEIAGIKLENPFINASGIFGLDIPDIVKTADAGVGAV